MAKSTIVEGVGGFRLVADYEPTGDQPEAIRQLVAGYESGKACQTLLGVTGSGKTFTMANVIAQRGMPTLVISHNKTLAAQLYGELRGYFPDNAVEYFISYYDYYQPEAYVPSTDTYIEKDASINDDIDRLRLKATSALMERKDVVIVASVSCIFGLGSPKEYEELLVLISCGDEIDRDTLLRRLVDIHYSRNDIEFARGTFRVRGDVVEVHPAYEEFGVRIELFGNQLDRISIIDPLTGNIMRERERIAIYPAKHFVTTTPRLTDALRLIEIELEERLTELRTQNKLLEAQRLETRTRYDLEMLREIGYCPGIENYSRHIGGRKSGERPYCLIDYFPRPFLTIIDESHVTIPQLIGMYHGDRSRKQTLVDFGFRLPSALDNRPLTFQEFEGVTGDIMYVSATPGDYELEVCGGVVVEQIIRPTGLADPEIIVRPVDGQIDDLIGEIRKRVERNERVLVTTLTKRMAEDLADYLFQMGIRVRYMHSEIDAIERVSILRGLRLADFDVLVGINLLREGLDLPEVSLVAILDADKEGYLRSERSLIQTAGRAARNVGGQVIMYADRITGSMKAAIGETKRRRHIQLEYNQKHGIIPRSIVKSVDQVLKITSVADEAAEIEMARDEPMVEYATELERKEAIIRLEHQMHEAARALDFETAAFLRDRIRLLRGPEPKKRPKGAKYGRYKPRRR
jgi:excinuclease ABC subunit B